MTAKIGSRLRLRKRELFRTIGYEPHGVQEEVHRSPARIRVLACGTRYGKSTCAAAEALAALLEPRERSLGWVVGPNLEVTGRVIERVQSLLHQYFPARIEKVHERDRRILVRNLGGGLSELRGKSADAPASLLGSELDWLVLDECSQIKTEVWQSHLSARLIDRRGWALLISTPGKMNWFYELFVRGQDGRDPGCQSWRAPTWDNPHVPRELLELEKSRIPEAAYMQQYGARFINEPPQRCKCCGFPSPVWLRYWFGDLADDLLHCRVCRQLVNERGTTQVHRKEDGTLVELVLLSGVPRCDENLNDPPSPAPSEGAGSVPGPQKT